MDNKWRDKLKSKAGSVVLLIFSIIFSIIFFLATVILYVADAVQGAGGCLIVCIVCVLFIMGSIGNISSITEHNAKIEEEYRQSKKSHPQNDSNIATNNVKKYCPYCGEPLLSVESSFCSACGSKL